MEWNPETLQFLSQCFLHTLSPQPEPRRAAESSLSEAADRPNYGLAVLRLLAEPSVDEQIRQAAAVNFKNHLRTRWAPSNEPNAGPAFSPILQPEKDQIKTLIVSLMLSSSPRIQSQLSEALAVIGKHDFPKSWPTLLPELISNLQKAAQSADYASINGILGTANSIFKKFRYQYKTNDLLLDLKYCLDNFAAPLLEIFLKTASLIDSTVASAGDGSPVTLRPLFESQRLCCRIFYSLNFQELPEFFEDHMREWMGEFKKYLTVSYPSLDSSANELALVDELRAAVCENISLYMEKNEEEFQGYLNDFASAVWSLLTNVSQSSSRDKLAVTAMKFLTTVSTSVHHTLFANEGVIPQICQSIVIPNVRLRDEDEELFEMNYVEFIRRDMEGSDLDTRRRIACELLKGIATHYKKQVTDIVSIQIQNLLSSFATNPSANWKNKDCAIYLVVSLATKKAGGTNVSTDLVDVQTFFTSVIVPELQSQDVNGFPMLKAGALKFFTMFRGQIQKPVAFQLFSDLVRYLGSESNVVHSYAASCIEKLLLVKEEGGKGRYTSADITPCLPVLMNNLFNALKFPESEENQYVMKCIMRVLGIADISSDIAGPCIGGLTSILNEVCKNPKNPIFNHYLFESVASLIRRACERDASLISAFEASLFPSLQTILANDVTEFLPYAFQLLAQLVELNRPPISPSYMQIFVLLLSPDSWTRSSNVPALVRLLQAFLQKAPHELNQEGRLNQVLGIFNMLISSPSTDEQGFYVLNTVIENLEFGVISSYMSNIWNVLFMRLQNRRTVKFQKSLVIFMSLFLVKHGATNLVDTMNAVQANIFLVILEQFWIPNLKLIAGAIELKLTAVASTRLICESPVLLDATAARHWGKMLDSIVTLLSRPEQDRVDEEPEMPDIAENVGYTATFVKLYNAGKKEDDPLTDIKDPKHFLVASLAKVSALTPGRFPQIINENLEPANQAALLQLCSTYNCTIV
ncbi:Cellular apoptosis susceptibility protein / importin-alpha re-exporter, putative isoform 1 [Theobroma cacao]|uniref:Cellular apoptosis susceptibility protein / importin-alpha re-exporter, putative isoform 1 n=1 Tax=Theobroma cacao TaxID=3641 RepID=A0A061DTJ9_THECC|nr:Cellular apoptosis susceptibility protein / importin-alpha re-exporter, putative isoform 1 [Theobroma cacao]EOX95682.1 Cellular apoptosis susceptibility protein / importin-alpha re-exporter, putative isoform 1 [Theobroma cacao]